MQKIPSSIHWLLVKRGRIDGSIQKIEEYLNRHKRQFEKYQQLTAELALLNETLVSVDQTLRLHKLQIDPSNIPAIRGRNPLTSMKRGELSRLIYERIKEGNGESVSSNEIVLAILEKRKQNGQPSPAKALLAQQVRYRLKNLCRNGVVIRHHSRKTTSYGRWTLSEKVIQDTQMTTGNGLGHCSQPPAMILLQQPESINMFWGRLQNKMWWKFYRRTAA